MLAMFICMLFLIFVVGDRASMRTAGLIGLMMLFVGFVKLVSMLL